MQKTDEAGFFGKNPKSAILGKKGPTWPKTRLFWMLTKIGSFDFEEIEANCEEFYYLEG